MLTTTTKNTAMLQSDPIRERFLANARLYLLTSDPAKTTVACNYDLDPDAPLAHKNSSCPGKHRG